MSPRWLIRKSRTPGDRPWQVWQVTGQARDLYTQEASWVDCVRTVYRAGHAAPAPMAAAAAEPAVLDVAVVALQEIDRVVGNSLSLSEQDTTQVRALLQAALSQRCRLDGGGPC